MVYLEKYPIVCQSAMDAQADFLKTSCVQARADDAAHAAAGCSNKTQKLESDQWHWYEIGGLILGSIAVGFTAGVIAEHHH